MATAASGEVTLGARVTFPEIRTSLQLAPGWAAEEPQLQGRIAIVPFTRPQAGRASLAGGSPPMCVIVEDARGTGQEVAAYASKSRSLCEEMMSALGTFQLLADEPCSGVGPFSWRLEYILTFAAEPMQATGMPMDQRRQRVVNLIGLEASRLCFVTLQCTLRPQEFEGVFPQVMAMARTFEIALPTPDPPGVLAVLMPAATGGGVAGAVLLPDAAVTRPPPKTADPACGAAMGSVATEDDRLCVTIHAAPADGVAAAFGVFAGLAEREARALPPPDAAAVAAATGDADAVAAAAKAAPFLYYEWADLRKTDPAQRSLYLPVADAGVVLAATLPASAWTPQVLDVAARALLDISGCTAAGASARVRGLAAVEPPLPRGRVVYVNERLGVAFVPIDGFRVQELLFEPEVAMAALDDDDGGAPQMQLGSRSLGSDDPTSVAEVREKLAASEDRPAGLQVSGTKLGGQEALTVLSTEDLRQPGGSVRATHYAVMCVAQGRMVDMKWLALESEFPRYRRAIDAVVASVCLFPPARPLPPPPGRG